MASVPWGLLPAQVAADCRTPMRVPALSQAGTPGPVSAAREAARSGSLSVRQAAGLFGNLAPPQASQGAEQRSPESSPASVTSTQADKPSAPLCLAQAHAVDMDVARLCALSDSKGFVL